jgi:hypothetical protein
VSLVLLFNQVDGPVIPPVDPPVTPPTPGWGAGGYGPKVEYRGEEPTRPSRRKERRAERRAEAAREAAEEARQAVERARADESAARERAKRLGEILDNQGRVAFERQLSLARALRVQAEARAAELDRKLSDSLRAMGLETVQRQMEWLDQQAAFRAAEIARIAAEAEAARLEAIRRDEDEALTIILIAAASDEKTSLTLH